MALAVPDPSVSVDPAMIVERLRAIEEDLRDLAYDRLRESVDTGQVLAEERRLHQARRAIERAIRLLASDGEGAGDEP